MGGGGGVGSGEMGGKGKFIVTKQNFYDLSSPPPEINIERSFNVNHLWKIFFPVRFLLISFEMVFQ